jgi:hypothetical protein
VIFLLDEVEGAYLLDPVNRAWKYHVPLAVRRYV